MRMLGAVLLVLFPVYAYAESSGIPPVIENTAALVVASKWCKDYVVDVESALKIALGEKINPTKPPYDKKFLEARDKLESIMADTGVTQFCAVTYERFRPGGKVPGFMMKQ